MGNFNNLEVWEDSKKLAINIYLASNKGSFSKDFSLCDQIRRAAVSVPSNLAEGDESGSQKMSLKYFYIAKASLAELRTQFEIAREIGYVEDSDYESMMKMMILLSKRITKLIQHRQSLLK
ncbi:MAG: four helix bundle protein [Bacteroidetes bacterium]|nr:four helix bundle protein [Bacteroidota bacterium]